MPKQSAGILFYRIIADVPQVFLVHPGGPFFKNKDAGAWSIPKGEFLDDEDPLMAAKREFLEETGRTVDGDFIKLNPVKLKSGKTIYAWAVEGDIDHNKIVSNVFEIEWPPRSGKKAAFPEVDQAGWFGIEEAAVKVNEAQIGLLEELVQILSE
ncbi:NUDIX domain-containing protein [Mucilaginibacter auburnensis]|uniref:Putative NUDIX family NTP pyrophosphohydrolase n=1 Tax=Mucilaginibacter auburnensis TaxID=1457233 RepID=A0A2H9VUV3_9SPHI|nr:NUDIX domain-containing protein [Mucilaginibacter auburnensis]PJJ84610.1 putative NUDIX family NTP pyrophosphohydrolase [Mucilaginibacter auburnensis]